MTFKELYDEIKHDENAYSDYVNQLVNELEEYTDSLGGWISIHTDYKAEYVKHIQLALSIFNPALIKDIKLLNDLIDILKK